MISQRHSTSGFTLIELLIVVVIIGVLAAIAIPKFANTKDKAMLATMKADLRNLATAQEGYLYDNHTYYTGAVPGAGLEFQPSTGVSITVSDVSAGGWAGVAQHANVPGSTCALFIGAAGAVAPAVDEGQIRCN
jgi:prepilin-type N-terminal cleavage/methylation domain-containing protein